jgi:hypothetical protein
MGRIAFEDFQFQSRVQQPRGQASPASPHRSAVPAGSGAAERTVHISTLTLVADRKTLSWVRCNTASHPPVSSSSSLQHSHSLTPVTNSPLSISGISIHRNTLIRQPPAHRIGSRVTTIYGNGAFRETRLGLDSTLAPALHHAPIEWEVEPIAIAATIFLSLNVRIDISFIHSHRHVKPGSSGCRAGVGWSALHWAASVGRRSWHRCSSSDDGLGQPAICSKPQPDCEYHNHSRPDSLSPLFSFLFWRSGHCTKPSASQPAQHHGRD